MRKKNSPDFDIDELLKKALKEDLPPEVEIGMKRQLHKFRKKIERPEPERSTRTVMFLRQFFHGPRWQSMRWIFRKDVLASTSVLLVALGGFLHISGSHNSLTENISLLGTSVLVYDQVSHTESMECSVEIPEEKDTFLKYSIQWLSPNLTRVQVKKSDETVFKTMWLSEEEIAIEDHIKDTVRKSKSVSRILDLQFKPVIELLSPHEMVEQLYGQWQLKYYERRAECELGIFIVTIPEEKAFLEITVDLCTYLPVNIKKFLLESTEAGGESKMLMKAEFRWNIPLLPQLMYPQSTKENQCV
ncbi:MAG: hypothetical protein ACETWK_14840 [Candidatus Aminicenantaceae bacterium]